MCIEIVSMISVIIAIITTGIALWQIRLNRKAMQAQTFVTIVNTAREIEFSRWMDLIRSLHYSNYNEFIMARPIDVQMHIREVVDFLNDLWHLIRYGYLTEEHVLNIYSLSIMACSERLLPWWIEGFRKEQGNPYYYSSFESLCEKVRKNSKAKLELKHQQDTPAE